MSRDEHAGRGRKQTSVRALISSFWSDAGVRGTQIFIQVSEKYCKRRAERRVSQFYTEM